MNATPARPESARRLSRTELRRRWELLGEDRVVAAIPCKVELNEKGGIEVSPPTVRHAVVQAYVMRELARQRPDGTTLLECPIETDIGIRVPDVIWVSPNLMEQHRLRKQFRVAPELCVEVLSPTNTRVELAEKTAAYLAAGANEVWIVDENGAREIHTSQGPAPASTLGFTLSPLPPD